MVAFAREYRRGVIWLYNPANRQQAIEILVKYAHQDEIIDAYDYYVVKLKLFGPDGDVSDKSYDRMAAGLAEIVEMKNPYPQKSAIFDGSIVQAAAQCWPADCWARSR